MKNIFKVLLFGTAVMFTSCESLVEGINDDPNGITIEDVDPNLFLTGAMLANTTAQAGHANRIAGIWSGQLVGITSVYGDVNGYNISAAETNSTWSNIYVGVIPNVRHIRNNLPGDNLMQGIAKTLEAQAIGTAASLFGDVPFSEINNEEIDDPKFDGQISVLNAVIDLLDEAVGNFNAASSRSFNGDIYYGGDKDKWLEAANTLKARYYMLLKDYPSAYSAAQNGISSSANTMRHIPRGEPTTAQDKNLFWEMLTGRAGDIAGVGSYLSKLLDSADPLYRGNAKTDETARSAYSVVNENNGGNNGIVSQYEAQQLVSFEENHLILAEAGARASFATGLTHLNEFRAWLDGGGRLNDAFSGMAYNYDAYDAADFMAGGMENADGIADVRALIREIVEERYVSGFGELMPFDDARRLRGGDSDVDVDFPASSGSQHAERLPYADDELNSNSNGPGQDPGIFTKTAVNQ